MKRGATFGPSCVSLSETMDAWARCGLDMCVEDRGIVLLLSDHDYSYSMGFGDAWSVRVLTTIDEYRKSLRTAWLAGLPYNYGDDAPHYPVPVIVAPHYYHVPDVGTWEAWPDGRWFTTD